MQKQTILIVDDDHHFLKSLTLALEGDFHILAAKNGREACLLFKSNPSLSLILLDLDMPIMNGTEALAIIRGINKGVKVIIMTGRSSHDYAKKCASLNVQGYLEKPFDAHKLLSQIKKELGTDDFKVLKTLWSDDYEQLFNSISELNKRTIHYLEKHFGAKLNIRGLASHFKVSHEHLSRIFLKECGIHLKEYIRKIKIERGKESLIKNPDFTIKGVAASIGMDDDKHFCRIFKEDTGVTPGEYRKTNIF